MEYLTLKNSDLHVSRLCMGGCPMGGYGWGKVQEDELIEAVHIAMEQGINFFDTSDTYGLGQSERTLAKALGNRRNQVTIASKFGVRVEKDRTRYDNSPEWIRTALQNSLKRLNTDYIDLYQIHYRDGKTPIDTVVDTLEELKKAGHIRYYGISNIHQEDLAELQKHTGKFVSLQDEYSLACRKNENDLLELADKLNLTPMTWGSLGQGILTGKYDRTVSFGADDRRSRDVYVNFHGDKLLKNLEIVEAMKPIAAAHGKSVAAVAIRFILDHIPQSVVLCGSKRASQVLSNVEGVDWKLSEKEIKLLDKVSDD